jgi:hypothetical protein
LYYTSAGWLTACFKKNWSVIIFIFGAMVFHFALLFVLYSNSGKSCNLCIFLFLIEAVALVFYIGESKKLNFSNVFVLGIGKAVLLFSLVLVILNPEPEIMNSNEKLAFNENKIMSSFYEESGPTVKETVYAEKEEKQPKNTEPGAFISAKNQSGQTVKIDLSQKPALLFSWWSIECDKALKMMANLTIEERPYLVAVDLRGNNEKYVKKKLELNGVSGPYYICYEPLPYESVPSLVWWSNKKLNFTPWDFNTKKSELVSLAKIKIGTSNGAHNAKLAANAINGTKVFPGDVFSFNKTVGERTPVKGYEISMVVTNTPDGPVYSKGIGGGICLTSTALHWAVKKSGLEVVEHHRHSLPVEYGRESEDAAVAWPSLDYRFRNTTGNIIVLKTRSFGEFLEVEVWREN